VLDKNAAKIMEYKQKETTRWGKIKQCGVS